MSDFSRMMELAMAANKADAEKALGLGEPPAPVPAEMPKTFPTAAGHAEDEDKHPMRRR